MQYLLTYKKSVEKELRRLPQNSLQLIVRKIQALAQQPRPVNAIKLQGSLNLYRIRQGDYRVIYAINDSTITILVIKIGHRKDVYDR